MPVLTRWTIKTAMIYLVVGLAAGVLYWANAQWMLAPVFAALSPIYVHLLVVGWLTQLIFGVIYWMFPIIGKENMRGDPRLAWAVYGLLNAGLVLRVICEPWYSVNPNEVNRIGMVLSALLQVAAGYLFIVVCGPRVRERAGTGSA
jgi:hypothetical protein